MSQKKAPAVPAWYKNTYFWISGLLLLIGLLGLIAGDNTIRDPGQKVEHNLWGLYFVAAIVMLIGGIISHRQTVQQYEEEITTKA